MKSIQLDQSIVIPPKVLGEQLGNPVDRQVENERNQVDLLNTINVRSR